jgi:hypothetical protein
MSFSKSACRLNSDVEMPWQLRRKHLNVEGFRAVSGAWSMQGASRVADVLT